MVRAHCRGGIGNAYSLDRTGIIGGDCLILDHRHAGETVGLANHGGAAAEEVSQGRTLSDLLPEQAQDTLAVAKRNDTGLHGDGEHDHPFDRVDADVIHQVVGSGDIVQIVGGAVGAHAPDGFIFEARSQVVAVPVVVHLGALDDTTRMAAVFRLAATCDDRVVHGFTGDFVVSLELAVPEVPGRQAAGLVEDVDQDIGAVGRQGLTADRMIEQRLGKGTGRDLELVGIGDLYGRRALAIEGYELDLLGTHDRAEAAAPMAADLAVRVLDGDVGRGHPQFSGRTDGDDAGFLAETGFKSFNNRKIIPADEFGFFVDGHAVPVDVQAVPFVLSGEPLDDQRPDAQPGQQLGRCASRVALLDGSGEGTLGAGGEPAGIGGRRSGKETRGKDQLVVRPQGVTSRRHLGGHDGGGQGAPAVTGPFGRNVFSSDTQIRHVYAYNPVHPFSLSFVWFHTAETVSFPKGRLWRFHQNPSACLPGGSR